MKKFLIGLISGLGLVATSAYGISILSSQQEGANPINGYFLQTNGATSTWAAVSSGGSGGGGAVSSSLGVFIPGALWFSINSSTYSATSGVSIVSSTGALTISGNINSSGTITQSGVPAVIWSANNFGIQTSTAGTAGQWAIWSNANTLYSTSSQPSLTFFSATSTLTITNPSATGTVIINFVNPGYITTSTWIVNASGSNITTSNNGGSSTVGFVVNPNFSSLTVAGTLNASGTISQSGTPVVLNTRNVNTTGPWLTGGGALSSDLTLSFVNQGFVTAASSVVWTALQTFNVGASSTGNYFTSSTITDFNNALAIVSSTNKIIGYGGGTCGGGTAVQVISPTGTVSCVSVTATGGNGTVVTSSPVTTNQIPYWASLSGLNGTSSLTFFPATGNVNVTGSLQITGNLTDANGNKYSTSTGGGSGGITTSSLGNYAPGNIAFFLSSSTASASSGLTIVSSTGALTIAGTLNASSTITQSGTAVVLQTRNINTTAPLGGGGALSGDLTLTCTTCLTTTTVISAQGVNANGNTFTFATSGPLLSVSANANGTVTFTSIATSTILAGYSTSTGANPAANVGLSVVNGSANTFMRSDGAPALSQSIAPTWTALHTFNAGAIHNSSITLPYLIATTSTGSFAFGSTTQNLPNASGTWIAFNQASSTGADFIVAQNNSSTKFRVDMNGSTTVSNFVDTGVASALGLFGVGGALTGYGGASACSAGQGVTTISAVGATTCAAFLTVQALPTSSAWINGQFLFGQLGNTATSSALISITTSTGVLTAPTATFSGLVQANAGASSSQLWSQSSTLLGLTAVGTSTQVSSASLHIASSAPIADFFQNGQVTVGTTTPANASTTLTVTAPNNMRTASGTAVISIGNASSSHPGCIAFAAYPTGTVWGYLYLSFLSGGMTGSAGALTSFATTTPCN